jgi:sugar transferase (PEP-CTERM/EpsH1 system associated)
MDELLFLCHRIPYPPNKGDKIRSWHILDHLSQRYRVHLGCFVDDPEDWQYEAFLRQRCGDCAILPLNKRSALTRAALGALSGQPLSLGYYRNGAMADWVAGVLARPQVGGVFVFSSQLAQYVLPNKRKDLTRIIDFVDVDSEKWRQYAQRKRWPANWIYGWEGRALLAFERKVTARFDASVFVSADEAALFRRLVPESAGRVVAMSNGVDATFFAPENGGETPYPPGEKAIVFTGAMDYWANVDAVTWFAEQVFPRVRQADPQARFYIVGSNPSPEVTALGARPDVVVTGRVPDTRPYIAHAAVVVAPLRIARGIQNKVLEAMAMARPVVATPEALEGIPGLAGDEVQAAPDEQAMAARVGALLEGEDGTDMGARARAFVLRRFSWAHNLAALDSLLARGRGAP